MVSPNSTATKLPVATSMPEQFIGLSFYAQHVNSLPTTVTRNRYIPHVEKAVEMPECGHNPGSARERSHDTTVERIGWRVIPAVDLGGGDRAGVARAVVLHCPCAV